MRLKTKLQEVRKEAGFKSAREFAEKIGMSVGTYTDYEQGRRKFSLEAAWKFADELGVSLDELAGREWPRAAESLDERERGLVSCYRGLDPERKDRLLADAQDLALAQGARGAPSASPQEGVA